MFMEKIKIAAISDTHSKHEWLKIPPVDILVHTGDFTEGGTQAQAIDFFQWFQEQPAKYKIVIAGNHDFFMAAGNQEKIKAIIPANVIYLNDELAEVGGLRIWGSPIQPTFLNMAFNRARGKEIKAHWDLIPDNIDLLLTHGPAHGILDKTSRNKHVGCEELRKAVERQKPRVHICGHIHEAYGNVWHKGTLFINASSWHGFEGPINAPVLFEIGIGHLVAK
jgi:Icc-related predicted phosphoesterase